MTCPGAMGNMAVRGDLAPSRPRHARSFLLIAVAAMVLVACGQAAPGPLDSDSAEALLPSPAEVGAVFGAEGDEPRGWKIETSAEQAVVASSTAPRCQAALDDAQEAGVAVFSPLGKAALLERRYSSASFAEVRVSIANGKEISTELEDLIGLCADRVLVGPEGSSIEGASLRGTPAVDVGTQQLSIDYTIRYGPISNAYRWQVWTASGVMMSVIAFAGLDDQGLPMKVDEGRFAALVSDVHSRARDR